MSNSRNRSVEELEEVHASEAACAVCEGELGWWVTATSQRAGAWIRCESCDDTGHGERIARPRRQMNDPVVGELCIHVVKLLDDLTEKLKAEVAIRGITDEQVVAARDLVESKSPHPDSDAHAALLDRVVWGVGDDEGMTEAAS